MKIRSSIIWLVIFVAALMMLVVWHVKKRPTETPPSASVETNAPAVAIASSTAATPPAHASSSIPQTAPSKSVPTPPVESKEQQMRQGLARLNDEEIVLYGRVMDQFDSPVIGAAVTGSIQVNNGTRVGADKVSLLTDGSGFFTISGYKGKALGISVSKPGYVAAATNTYFVYSLLWPDSQRYTPDQNNPTVIKMWKLQGAQPLVGISKEYRLPFTEAPIYFDLVAGKIVPNGGVDLEIILTRAPGLLSKKIPADWSIDLKPVDGGIMESDYATSRITYEAPANGYQDDYLVRMDHDDPAWFDSIGKVFFVKSRAGEVYSRLSFDFRINDEPDGVTWFKFKGVANANGSRNWEATVPQ